MHAVKTNIITRLNLEDDESPMITLKCYYCGDSDGLDKMFYLVSRVPSVSLQETNFL